MHYPPHLNFVWTPEDFTKSCLDSRASAAASIVEANEAALPEWLRGELVIDTIGMQSGQDGQLCCAKRRKQ